MPAILLARRSLGSGSVSTVVHRLAFLTPSTGASLHATLSHPATRVLILRRRAFHLFTPRFPRHPSGRKSHAKRFASVSIVTSRPQAARSNSRNVFPFAWQRHSLSLIEIDMRDEDHLRGRPSRFPTRPIHFAACDLCFRLVTAPENVMRVHFRCNNEQNKLERQRKKRARWLTAGLRGTQARNTIKPVRLYDQILPST